MSFVSIILGVLLIIGGFSCTVTPIATFLSTGYYIAFLLIVFGISGIIRTITTKGHILDLITGILAVIVGGVSLARPGGVLIFDSFLLYFIAFWFIARGVSNIIMAILARDMIQGWFWGVIAGVLGIIVGCISFAHPMITALTSGIMMGLFFIEAGIDMICIGYTARVIEEAVDTNLPY